MQYIGRIDKNKFVGILANISSDEVIITDERIQHINNGRGSEFYETYSKYFSDVISDPDIIFEDKKYTAAVVKRIDDGVQHLNLILRLVAPDNDGEFKNSIITAIGIGDKRLETYRKNKKIVYKKE